MKIKQVTYGMLRKTRQYENDRVEMTVELEPGDTVEDATAVAKELCLIALGHATPAPPTQCKYKERAAQLYLSGMIRDPNR